MQVKTITAHEAATTYKDAPRARMDVGNITQGLKEAVSRALISEPGVTYVVEPVRPLRKTITENVSVDVDWTTDQDLDLEWMNDLIQETTGHTSFRLKSYTMSGIPGTEHIVNSPNRHTFAYRIGMDIYATFEEANAAMMERFKDDITIKSSMYHTKASKKDFIDACIIDEEGRVYLNGITYTCEYKRYTLEMIYERDIESEDVVIIYEN